MDENKKENKLEKFEHFNQFEKLDRKVEETIREVETMDKRKFYKNSFVFAGGLALLLNLVIETLGRFTTAGVFGGLKFMVSDPLVFLYNALIIFATLCVASVFKRRVFTFTVVSIFWLGIGIVNGVILTQRMTPFTVKDLSNLSDGLTIVTNYLKMWQIILVAAAIVIAIAALVLLFIKGPQKKDKLHRKRNLVAVCLVFVATFISSSVAISTGIVETFFGNLAYAYRDYGVVYCFTNTWLNTGIQRPSGYSEERIKDIFTNKELGDDDAMLLEQKDVDEQYPNLLFLQLESFIDPMTIKCIELSEDPCPNFRKLMSEYPSGELMVPACGAGTANVEFEVLTGLSVKFFGPGEYPYKSVLKEKPAESLAFDLDSLGYKSHAIHNHRAVFYNRNEVFANIGFNTFTSIEYMKNVAKTPKNWAKDKVLIECIEDALDSTPGRDMIYTISVQGHGKYPSEQVITNPKIKVLSAPTEELKWKYEYYVNQIHEMDKFVKELTTKLADYPEPVVLVMYGDHLPTMGLKVEDLENRYLYQTEYVIWDNMGLKRKQENIASYQIAAEVMNRVGIHDGTIFRYHQTRRNTKNYQVDLEVLQYDMLYGKRYVYGEDGETPYERVQLQMGALPVTLERVEKSGEDTWYFYGENFTASSRVEVNEEIQDTVYVSPSILMVHSLTLEDGDQITIAQQSNSSTKKVLTRTEPMMYEEPKTVSTPTPTPNPDSTKTDVTQENANTSTAPQDELTAAPSGAPEGEGDKIEPSKTENSDKPAEDGGLQN